MKDSVPGVVIGIGAGDVQAGFLQSLAKGSTAILAATVAGEDRAIYEASAEGLPKGFEDNGGSACDRPDSSPRCVASKG